MTDNKFKDILTIHIADGIIVHAMNKRADKNKYHIYKLIMQAFDQMDYSHEIHIDEFVKLLLSCIELYSLRFEHSKLNYEYKKYDDCIHVDKLILSAEEFYQVAIEMQIYGGLKTPKQIVFRNEEDNECLNKKE